MSRAARTVRASALGSATKAVALVGTLVGVAVICGCGGKDAPTHEAAPTVQEDPDGGWVLGIPGSFAVRTPHGELAKRLDAVKRSEGSSGDGLGSIGYAQGFEGVPKTSGVLTKVEGRVKPAPTLLVHGNAAAAELIDISGKLLHRWALSYGELPDAPPLEGDHQIPWRAVELLRDGGLIAIHSGRAIVRVDKDSNLKWVTYGRFHHDLARDGSGNLLTLSRQKRLVPEVHATTPIVDDMLVALDIDTGDVTAELSLWDALKESPYEELLDRLTVREGDVMHANGLWPVTADSAEAIGIENIRAGSVLVCMRDLDLVACVENGAVQWLTQGPRSSPWRGLHDPTVTRSGTLLVFDNLGGPGGTSRLVEIRPSDGSIAWTYGGVPPEAFHSLFCGTVQVLENGNLLAAESCNGRAIELNPKTREIVWEYVSPHVTGPGDRYVAALFDAVRVEGPIDWLE